MAENWYGCRGVGEHNSGPTDILLVGGLVRAGWIGVRRNINPLLEKQKSLGSPCSFL